MKLIIDINDNEYIGIKEYPDNVTSYPVTIHLYDAVKNGIPLDNLRAEIEQITDTMGVSYNRYVSKIDVLQIIDKYRKEVNNG